MSQDTVIVHSMTLDDKNSHPSVSQKQPGVVIEDGRIFIQFAHGGATRDQKFNYVATDEGLILDISTEWGAHLHYLLTHGLFDEIAMYQGMPEGYYGDDSAEPF